jgi:hypothetical protein
LASSAYSAPRALRPPETDSNRRTHRDGRDEDNILHVGHADEMEGWTLLEKKRPPLRILGFHKQFELVARPLVQNCQTSRQSVHLMRCDENLWLRHYCSKLLVEKVGVIPVDITIAIYIARKRRP